MNPLPVQFVQFAPAQALPDGRLGPDPAAAGSVARFEQLLYAPDAGGVRHAAPTTVEPFRGASSVLQLVDQMSDKWRAGQRAITDFASKGTLSMSELILVQKEMINSTVNVEISSKATDLLESGVQSIMNRNQ
jgi:hypothetical protein